MTDSRDLPGIAVADVLQVDLLDFAERGEVVFVVASAQDADDDGWLDDGLVDAGQHRQMFLDPVVLVDVNRFGQGVLWRERYCRFGDTRCPPAIPPRILPPSRSTVLRKFAGVGQLAGHEVLGGRRRADNQRAVDLAAPPEVARDVRLEYRRWRGWRCAQAAPGPGGRQPRRHRA